MRIATHLLRSAFVLALILSALSAHAQTLPPAPTVGLPAPPPTSITYGLQSNYFAYLSADSSHTYRFESSSQAIMFSGEGSYLLLSYGSQPVDSAAFAPGLSMIQAQAGLGGQSYLFENMFGLPLRAFIPTQLQLGYRYLAPGSEDFSTLGRADVEPLHLASAGLALGAGADARIPKLVPVLEDRLMARAMLLFGAGATTNVLTQFEELGLMGSRELHLEARLERVLGNKTGVTIGYVFRQQNWALGTPESVQDVLEAFLEPGNLDQKSTQHLVRIGLNF